ncbi:response regulator transcription factor [Paraburkholderia sediminicola]|jgi:DNA-binding response OmpR family regulator|uniref:response regulator transcription factor n=1 Tax=Paraburkholderia sediminicola TaxID=458836 RepID=UPI0038B92498
MRIAVLDDDVTQANMVCRSLAVDGHACHTFSEGRELETHLRRQVFDLLILDWSDSGMPGEEMLRWVRQSLSNRPPLLFMTSHSRETDIASMLNQGVNDYVVKPIAANVLLARVKSLVRRASQLSHAVITEMCGEFEFWLESKQVVARGLPITLTQKQFELALLLFRHLGQPLSRAYILKAIWKQSMHTPSRTLDVHVSMLRTKLALRPENGFRLTPVYGYGYRLERIEKGDV